MLNYNFAKNVEFLYKEKMLGYYFYLNYYFSKRKHFDMHKGNRMAKLA